MTMRSNRLSKIFGISTFGESHGAAIGLLIDSPLPNLDFPTEAIKEALARRSYKSAHSTPRHEPDDIEILSGIFEGKTTGMPLCIIIRNHDHRSIDYEALKEVFRPGHADFSWFNKYLIHDYRGGGRSSGRETLARVIASKLCESLLEGIQINISTLSIGKMQCPPSDAPAQNPHHWQDEASYPSLMEYLNATKAEKDSLGGVIRVVATKVPAGLGDPIYEKLSANIAKAMLSIGTVRGITFGDGIELAQKPGSRVNDRIAKDGSQSNHHGGILGGVSTGQDLIFELIIRPVSSIGKPQRALTKSGIITEIELSGRHDSCHIPRIIPVIEAMLKLTLADAIQAQKLISHKEQTLTGYREILDKLDEELLLLLHRRKEIVKEVKLYKAKNKLPLKDTKREEEIAEQARRIALEFDLDPDLAEKIIKLSIKQSSL